MYKVLVTHNIPGDGLSELRQRCQVVTPPEGQLAFSRQQILEHMADVDGVLACAAIDAEMIAAAPKLKIISNYGAGYDRIDTAAAAARGIPVTNIPDDTMQATAELALALLMSLSRRVTELDRALRAGEQGPVSYTHLNAAWHAPIIGACRRPLTKPLNQQPKPQKSHKRPKGKEQASIE